MNTRKLLAYWEVTQDDRANELLDVIYETKIVLPLQRAFFNKRGWPYKCYLINGTGIRVLGRAKCDEKLMDCMRLGGKRTKESQPQDKHVKRPS